MKKHIFLRSLIVVNLVLLSLILTTILVRIGYINKLFARPILGGVFIGGGAGGAGGNYMSDWGSDTTNRKAGGVLVLALADVSAAGKYDIQSTNYRFGTRIKEGIIARAVAVSCKEIMMPYDIYGKNYTSTSYDNLRFIGNSLGSILVRNKAGARNNAMWYAQGSDGSSANNVAYYRQYSNRNNQVWSNIGNITENDTSRMSYNYGFPVICKK